MSTRLLLLLMLAVVPGLAHALGLGKLQLDSALNEPFEARIELLSATIEELDSLNVRLADEAAFRRADIPRPHLLTQLNFVVKQTESGPDYIRIYSNDPIREPFLNFLLEVSWAKGRLYREYTVLLDPPIYADTKTQQRLAQAAPVAEAETSGTITGIEDNRVVYSPDYTKRGTTTPARTPVVSRPVNYTGGDYGPTISGDTLWSIASAMRPDSSISVQQMMFALMRANPEAFINGNINGLRRDHVLKMPDQADIQSISKDDAFAQTKSHNGLWEELRQGIATVVTPRPEATTVAEPAPPAPVVEEPVVAEEPETPSETPVEEPATPAVAEPEAEPELRLVAPAAEGEAEGAAGPSGEQLANELALANESLEALSQENLELKDKLSETEAIIDDLKRLIVLKESELAALQQQIAEQEAAEAAALAAQQEQEAAALEEMPVTEEAEEIIEEPVVEEAAPLETMVPAEEVSETPVAEEPVAEAEEMPAEEATTEVVAEEEPAETETTEATDVAAGPMIPPVVSGILEIVKSNLLYIGGGLGALILIGLIVSFVKRRRSESAVVIPESAFPDFADEAAVSEDATDINPALADVDSESPTILPGSEDATDMPEFGGDDKTQIMPAGAPVDDGDPDAFQIPEGEQEEDPLHEVNIFLAYEQFDQAEQFVKKMLDKNPGNLEFHAKLLEVYYAANNKKGYEAAAKVLHDKVKGKGDYWTMAVAMWQEISPNRALFEQPAAGEDEEAATPGEGGGIVNIAGDGAAAGGLDLDLDTTSGSGDVLDMTVSEPEADMLDVTSAVDMEDDAMLDVTSAADEALDLPASDENEMDISSAGDSDMLDISLDMSKPDERTATPADDALELSLDAGGEAAADDNALDFSLELDNGGGGAVADDALELSLDAGAEPAADDNALDISLDMSSGLEEGTPADAGLEISIAGSDEAATAGDDNALDFSLDMDKPEAQADDAMDISLDISRDAESEESDAGLEISLDADASQDASTDAAMDFSLDISQDVSTPAEEADTGMDISLDASDESSSPAAQADNLMDFSFDLETSSASEAAGDALDMSLDTGSGAGTQGDENALDISLDISQDRSAADEVSLDLSLEQGQEEPAKSASGDALDMSFNISDDDKGSAKPGQADLLDVTSAISLDDDFEIESAATEDKQDLLDVTRTRNFQPDSDQELLDVTTSATSAGMDALDMLDISKAAGAETEAENNELDFELMPDADNAAGIDADSGFSGIDITTGQDASGDALELALDDAAAPSLPEIDMDSTMQIPSRAAVHKEVDEPPIPSANDFSLVLDEEEDDADHTIMVPRSKGVAEQSADDEIATQLDLAKAYLELGETSNAKTILDEIMAIGNAQQKQQAQELLSQL